MKKCNFLRFDMCEKKKSYIFAKNTSEGKWIRKTPHYNDNIVFVATQSKEK